MGPLYEFDRALIGFAQSIEHPVLTSVFVVLSTWWVKGPVLLGLAAASDAVRRRAPIAFAAAAAATAVASLLVALLKEVFDRARPPESDPGLGALVSLPDTHSFPSGHAASAFAAATAIAVLSPKLRPWALGLALAVALSRVYLRVHFPIDIVAGGLIGAALGALAALVALRVAARAAARPQPG